MNSDQMKINKINQFFAFLLTIITTLIILILLSKIPNKLNTEYILQNYIQPLSLFVPELSEKLQYMIGILSFFILYIIFDYRLKKIKYYKHIDLLCNIIFINSILIIIGLVLVINIEQPFYINFINFLTNPVSNFIVYIIIAFLFTTIIGMYGLTREKFKKVDIVFPIITLLTIIKVASLYIINTYYYNNYFVSFHFDAYFYPVYKVYCGYTPLVDFDNLYGFYPYFLVPIFKLFGGINIYRFSIVMAFLVFISLLALAIVLYTTIKNKLVAFLGHLALLFIIIIFQMISVGRYYLQYWPNRILFPMIFAALCTVYVKVKSKKLKLFIDIMGYVVAALSLLWNIDTGIVIVIAYLGFHIYQLAFEYDLNNKKLWINVIKRMCYSIISVFSSYLLLVVITFIRTNQIIHIKDVLYGQKIFYGSGFGMLRMPLVNQWILLMVIYAIALVKSLRCLKFLNRDGYNVSKINPSLYFMFSVVGLGIFSYYQGRSHLYTLTPVVWPGIVLLIFFTDENITELIDKIQNKIPFRTIINNLIKSILLIMILSVFALAFILNINKSSINTVALAEDASITPILNELSTMNDEKVDIISFNAASIYCIRKDTNIANVPATIDWFTKEDIAKVINYISNTQNNKLLIDITSYNCLKTYMNDQFTLTLSRYNLIKQTEGYLVWELKNR